MRNCLLSILTLVFFGSQPAYAQLCTKSGDSIARAYREIEKQSALQASLDSDFCRRNSLLEYLDPEDGDEVSSTMSLQELEELANKKFAFASRHVKRKVHPSFKIPDADAIRASEDPWKVSLISSQSTREYSYLLVVEGFGATLEEVHGALPNMTPMTSDQKVIARKYIQSLKSQKVFNLKTATPVLFAACIHSGLKGATDCTSALKKEADAVFPVGINGGTKFNNLDDWETLLMNDKYDAGLQRAAIIIRDRVQAKNAGPESENIFDDLKKSFEESKMSSKEAADAALLTLAVIANGGPNTANRALQLLETAKGSVPTKVLSLGVIAGALPLLDDLRSRNKQKIYSLPAGITSRCDGGKSYHFWMMARLAQRMSQEKDALPGISARAAFTLEKGYQLNREVGRPAFGKDGKTGERTLQVPIYSPSSNLNRGDLALASAGALYGENFATRAKLKINVDEAIAESISQGEQLAPLSSLETFAMNGVHRAIRWSKIFAPDKAFETIKKQIEAASAAAAR